jgi:hypothetical protein
MDTDDEFKGIRLGICPHGSSGDREPSQLNGKQSHSGFNYNEGDRTKLIPAGDITKRFIFRGSDTLDLSEDPENPEHN